jgi:hypothetical protein
VARKKARNLWPLIEKIVFTLSAKASLKVTKVKLISNSGISFKPYLLIRILKTNEMA